MSDPKDNMQTVLIVLSQLDRMSRAIGKAMGVSAAGGQES